MNSKRDRRFGLFPWFEEHGTDLIHPNDLTIARALAPYGKVLHALSAEGGFLVLAYGTAKFRGATAFFREIDTWIFGVGEAVLLRDGRRAEVLGVQWHYEKKRPLYQLRVDGKKTTKRFWPDDFVQREPL